ncbi:MAG: SDR family oxidoreductase [Rhabdochlamydiaceae bacterium]|nr:SDR family oxidoreductase [Candidatus Amphrikana amoebophyrae]
MKFLLLGKRSMLAQALAKQFQKSNINFDWVSYDEIIEKPASFFSPFTHVFNCIAYTNVDGAQHDKERALAINCHFIQFLIEKISGLSSKIIHYSTDYVFDGNSQFVYNEESKSSPINVYGETKRLGEVKLLNAMQNALVIRTSWLYGEGKNNFVKAILNRFLQDEEVKVVSDQIGTSTLTDDLAWASMHLLNSCGLFHFTNNGSPFSRFEWAKNILDLAKEIGFPLKVKTLTPVESSFFSTLATRPQFSALSIEKFICETEQQPRNHYDALKAYLTQIYTQEVAHA